MRLWHWLWGRRNGAARPATDLPSDTASFSLHLPRAADWKKALLDPAAMSTAARASTNAS
jgi:hypothetical protein